MSIVISDLNPANADPFMNSESFITELTDEQINGTHGGELAIFLAGVIIGMLIA